MIDEIKNIYKKVFTPKAIENSTEETVFSVEFILKNLDINKNVISLADIEIAHFDKETELYKIDENIYNTLDLNLQNAIVSTLIQKGYSHIIRKWKINSQNTDWENFTFNFDYIQQNKSWDCVLASVANAISLNNWWNLPKWWVSELRNVVIEKRVEEKWKEYALEIIDDNSPLKYSDYVNLIQKFISPNITQENLMMIDWSSWNEYLSNQLLEIYDKLVKWKIIFLWLQGHANFIRKIWKDYYLFDSMIDNWFEKFNNEEQAIFYIENKLNLENKNDNFVFIS